MSLNWKWVVEKVYPAKDEQAARDYISFLYRDKKWGVTTICKHINWRATPPSVLKLLRAEKVELRPRRRGYFIPTPIP